MIQPYGGKLVDLLIGDSGERREAAARADRLPGIRLSTRSLCDLELLATGAFSPLDRFMGEADYRRALSEMRLAGGLLFPMPITLPVDERSSVRVGDTVALRDARDELMALMTVEERFAWRLEDEARHVFGTTDAKHPLVAEMARWGKHYLSGPLRVVSLPKHHSFVDLRRTPAEVRRLLEAMGRENVVAFQTRNPLHRAHEELTKRAMEERDAGLLIHPVVGLTRPGDVDAYTRVRCYRALVKAHYDPNRTLLSLLPLAMRMGGPREAIWHAIIRRNFGANHFIVGRDHAGPGKDSTGKPFYGPYDAQRLLVKHQDEIGVKAVPFEEMVYLPDEDRYEEAAKAAGRKVVNLSGTEARDYLSRGEPLPAWFTRPEVAAVLAGASPPRHRQGFCVWLTAPAGADASTLAGVLASLLMERGRQVTLLDDQDMTAPGIGFFAPEVVRHHGAVICAATGPYRAERDAVRTAIGKDRFLLIDLNPDPEAGAPDGPSAASASPAASVAPDLALDTTASPTEDAGRILGLLSAKGFLAHD